MKILRYTPKVQKILGSKTAPEPWMHVAVITSKRTHFYGDDDDGSGFALSYAIYIWDTRQVIEAKHFDSFELKREYALSKCAAARDNHEQLSGSGNIVQNINKQFASVATEAEGLD